MFSIVRHDEQQALRSGLRGFKDYRDYVPKP